MLKQLVLVMIEVAVALAVAGALLAVIVPVLVARHTINPGDLAGSVVIVTVLLLAVGAMLFRPGSALRRRERPEIND
jgi:hypothetical protein